MMPTYGYGGLGPTYRAGTGSVYTGSTLGTSTLGSTLGTTTLARPAVGYSGLSTYGTTYGATPAISPIRTAMPSVASVGQPLSYVQPAAYGAPMGFGYGSTYGSTYGRTYGSTFGAMPYSTGVTYRTVGASAGKPKIGLLNPQKYMAKYLKEIEKKYDITYLTDIDDGTKGPGSIIDSSEEAIQRILGQVHQAGLPAVVGLAQKDSWQHSILNRSLGHTSISSLAYLIAMNKYMQRVLEEEAKPVKGTFFFAPVTPEVETDEQIAAKIPPNEWPIMLKNTSLSLGRGVFRVKNKEKLFAILAEYRANVELQEAIKATNDGITERFSQEDMDQLGDIEIPPFLLEHCVNLDDGWVEYCYEGCINEQGKLTHYGFTEELYDTEHAGIGYVTPPMNFRAENIPELQAYLEGYMAGLIERGYLKQFFNVEIWGLNKPDGAIDFCFCEINPRCAHAYHIPYSIAYGTSLWSDNFNLVLYNQTPTNTPWNKWRAKQYKVSMQTLINVMGSEGKKVSEVLDYTFVDYIEKANKVDLVRHVKQRDHVLNKDDAEAGAGCTLLQIFKACNSHAEAAAYEMALRDLCYLIKQDSVQPAWWIEKGKAGMDACKQKLTAGMPK